MCSRIVYGEEPEAFRRMDETTEEKSEEADTSENGEAVVNQNGDTRLRWWCIEGVIQQKVNKKG